MTRGGKLLIAGALLATAAAALYWFLTIPATPTPAGETSRARFTPGPWAVVTETFTVVDESRPTPAYGTFSGLPSRILEAQLWRPADAAAPGPLVVYSHGFMSFREEGLYLVRFLASHGYTVVAANYPLTGYAAPDGPLVTDVVNQPGDVTALIDHLLARNADTGDSLHGSIDAQRIAVAGVSLGGLTSMLAAYHPRLQDARIAAAVSIAGPGSLFTPRFFAGSEVPLLLVYGTEDAIVTYRENARHLLDLYRNAILVSLENASHTGFAQPASTLMRFIDNPDAVGCKAVTSELDVELARRNAAFVAALGDAQDGIDIDGEIELCAGELAPVTMAAALQQMYTTLAVHAFLESRFAAPPQARRDAREFLLSTLERENAPAVSVRTAPLVGAHGSPGEAQ